MPRVNVARFAAYTRAMSHVARLFVDQPLKTSASVALDQGQSKYLLRVMRLQEGEMLRAFNGRDGEWRCALRVSGKTVALEPIAQMRAQTVGLDLTLMFAPIKKTRTDFIVEKASELGVKTLQPVITEYTQSARVRTDRLQNLVIEAAEQTERLDVPDVRKDLPLAKALAVWDETKPLYHCDEGSEAQPIADGLRKNPRQSAGFLIGPEGGFSPREREMLHALDFVVPVTLGPRILRAETAAVSVLSLWQALVGDWTEAPYVPEITFGRLQA
ncbi:MAG: 16S rRNA (uracil(1498)-N(3))-methyltransferase [Pseudomonadota bacterium]